MNSLVPFRPVPQGRIDLRHAYTKVPGTRVCTYITCVAPPTKKCHFRFYAQIYDWKHLYLCIFLVPTFRRSATTSATLLIPKCTTRRWTLGCSNCSVAKRQQFSCALSTATLSLKFENVVPEGWIGSFLFYIQVIFLLLYSTYE